MRPSLLHLQFLAVAVGVVALSACSTDGARAPGAISATGVAALQQTAASSPVDQLNKRRVTSGVYVAMEQQANLFAIPDANNGAPACTLPTQASKGIGIDANGTLWVPNASGIIASYKKGSCKAGPRTLTDTIGIPNDIAFSSTGTAYVVVETAKPIVSVYRKGSSAPTSSLSDPAVTGMRGVAVDGAGNVFVSCVKEQERSCVMEFKRGAMPGTFLNISVGISDGLEIDAKHNLVVVDPGAREAELFAPPYQGAPTSAFALRGSSEFGKLDAANANFYASNFSSGTIDVFTYPAGTYEYSISNGLAVDGVWGIAVYPPSRH
jgi:hypothetical protein